MPNLELELLRTYVNIKNPKTSEIGTFGELTVADGEFDKKTSVLYTCEDEVRDLVYDISKTKVKKHTAIPMGVYELDVTMSPKFKRFLPILLGVESFDGIRLHSGATPKHTEGCPLIGTLLRKEKGLPVSISGGIEAEKILLKLLGEEKNGKFIKHYDKIYLTVIISADATWGES